jgi:RNA polymerase sigma factor (sigma-70 family)
MEASALTTAGHSGLLARRSPLLRLQGDEKLIALIREGHDRAFEVLFDRYHGRLLSFCRHMVGSSQDAEDLLQEVFVAAHTAMLADERPINARAWLYRIARSRCLNHLRRPCADGQDSMDVHAHANGATTLDRVQRREELRSVVADIHELPETQRSALVMRELDGLSYTEIAQAMGITLAAVKSLLVRARISLAEASEARIIACDDVRLELAEAAEGLRKVSRPARRHAKECPSCGRFRGELRSTSRSLAGLAPFGLFAALRKLFGKLSRSGSGSGGGSAGSAGGTAGSAGGAGGAAGGGAGAAGSVSAAGSVGAASSISGAAAAAGGSGLSLGGALEALGGVVGAKAAVGVATAALITTGAVGANQFRGNSSPQRPAPALAKPTNQWAVKHTRAATATATATPATSEGTANPEAIPSTETAPPAEVPPTEPAPAPDPVADAPPAHQGTGEVTDDSGHPVTTTTDDGSGDGTVDGSSLDGGTDTTPPTDTTTDDGSGDGTVDGSTLDGGTDTPPPPTDTTTDDGSGDGTDGSTLDGGTDTPPPPASAGFATGRVGPEALAGPAAEHYSH